MDDNFAIGLARWEVTLVAYRNDQSPIRLPEPIESECGCWALRLHPDRSLRCLGYNAHRDRFHLPPVRLAHAKRKSGRIYLEPVYNLPFDMHGLSQCLVIPYQMDFD